MLFGIVAAAVVMRAARSGGETPTREAADHPSASGQSGLTTNLVPGTGPGGQPQTTPPPEPKGTLDTVLPFVTEGGIAMILGLLLGMITRSFLKALFVFLILGFAGVQYLNYKGVVTINWGAMKDFVLNMVPKGASLSQVVQQKLPSLGAFGIGYLLGLKRG